MYFQLLSFASLALAGTYSQLPAVFPNPTNVTSYIYIPTTVVPNPPVLVVPHWCHGSALDAYNGSPFRYHADTYGYLIVYPDSPNLADKCWDVASNYSLTHDGGGDSQGIISATNYVLQKYNGDPRRVFVQGTSSGAMMTNVLLATYPDVFAAGSAWAGVAAGCFAGPTRDYWNSDCASGLVVKTGDQWKQIVLNAYPGYTGYRPKMQVFHGSVDTTLNPQNLQEEIKEWTAVFGLSSTPTQTLQNTPLTSWTKYVYGDGSKFTATLATGVDHNIQTQLQSVVDWFDLQCTSNCFGRPDASASSSTIKASSTTRVTTTISSTSVRTTSVTKTTTSVASASPSGNNIKQWDQCGGQNWTGSGSCIAPSKCVVLNPYYSQCQ